MVGALELALCLALSGAEPTRIPTGGFTLSWVHSIEKTEWRETWTVKEEGIRPARAMVKGSGAGMEPPEGARLVDGWWVYEPRIPAQDRVVLAASSFAAQHTLCVGDRCAPLNDWVRRPVGDERPVHLFACNRTADGRPAPHSAEEEVGQ